MTPLNLFCPILLNDCVVPNHINCGGTPINSSFLSFYLYIYYVLNNFK